MNGDDMTDTALTPTAGRLPRTYGADPHGEFGTLTLDELDLAPEAPDDDSRLLQLAREFSLLSDTHPEEIF